MCRWVEGVVIVGAGADAGATKSVLGDTGAAGDSERGSMADGRARVPEVLAPAELEGFLAWVMGPELQDIYIVYFFDCRWALLIYRAAKNESRRLRCDLDTRALKRASDLELLREPPEP